MADDTLRFVTDDDRRDEICDDNHLGSVLGRHRWRVPFEPDRDPRSYRKTPREAAMTD